MRDCKKFHFIAIGGIGMSALAKYLLELGCEVSGSDIAESKYSKELEKMGAKVFIGHNADNVPVDAVVVASSAIKPENPEYKRAVELGLEILHRADILKLIAEGHGKDVPPLFIGFAGTHGKTTTSGLCSYVLEKANLEPSYAVGGIIPELGTNSKCNSGRFFIAELDESDGTIVKYSPDVTVINNLEVDHIDFYTDGFETLLKTFNQYLAGLKSDAKVIINTDCLGCQKLKEVNPNINFITFGLLNEDYAARNIKYDNLSSQFDVYQYGECVGAIRLSVLGKHNVYNALAVVAALMESDVSFASICKYFPYFTGMGRRFEAVAEFRGINIYDDYAHHPSEIKVTLDGVKNLQNKRIVTVFQPHRYTRLKGLWDEFLTAFENTDKLIVLDVYSAGDPFDSEYNSKKFSEIIKHPDCIYISGAVREAAEKILPMLKANDIVITMGAGDITKLGGYLAELNESKVH